MRPPMASPPIGISSLCADEASLVTADLPDSALAALACASRRMLVLVSTERERRRKLMAAEAARERREKRLARERFEELEGDERLLRTVIRHMMGEPHPPTMTPRPPSPRSLFNAPSADVLFHRAPRQ